MPRRPRGDGGGSFDAIRSGAAESKGFREGTRCQAGGCPTQGSVASSPGCPGPLRSLRAGPAMGRSGVRRGPAGGPAAHPKLHSHHLAPHSVSLELSFWKIPPSPPPGLGDPTRGSTRRCRHSAAAQAPLAPPQRERRQGGTRPPAFPRSRCALLSPVSCGQIALLTSSSEIPSPWLPSPQRSSRCNSRRYGAGRRVLVRHYR